MDPILIALVVVALATSIAAVLMPSNNDRAAARREARDKRLAEQLGAWR